jgi:hypothetical protein
VVGDCFCGCGTWDTSSGPTNTFPHTPILPFSTLSLSYARVVRISTVSFTLVMRVQRSCERGRFPRVFHPAITQPCPVPIGSKCMPVLYCLFLLFRTAVFGDHCPRSYRTWLCMQRCDFLHSPVNCEAIPYPVSCTTLLFLNSGTHYDPAVRSPYRALLLPLPLLLLLLPRLLLVLQRLCNYYRRRCYSITATG